MAARPPVRPGAEAGFTLVEVLVVILVVAVLTSIAVPVFLAQRRKAADAALKSDLRSAAHAMEAWYADGYTNGDATDVGSGYLYQNGQGDSTLWPWGPESKTAGFPTIKLSPGTGLGIRYFAAQNGYCVLGMNRRSNYRYAEPGVGTDYSAFLYFDSLAGGVVTRAQIPASGACHVFR